MLFNSTFATEYTLSICAIFQNEAPYLKEWIEYHKLQGVEHFWLYNNESTDNWKEILTSYMQEGTVELIDWPNLWPETPFPFGCQAKAYSDGLHRARKKTRWLALIDIDEFLLPLQEDSVRKTLEKHFRHESGVYIGWLNFGTSHVQKIQPNELMIEKLIMCATPSHAHNNYSKSIVRPKYVHSCENPHYCNYLMGKHRDDDRVKQHLRINHYWCRDEWFLENTKIPRYEKWGVSGEDIRKLAESFNDEINLDIQRFVPQLAELNSHCTIQADS